MDIHAQDLTPDDLSRLPGMVRDFARIAGLESAIACVNAFRGMQITIPKGEDNNTAGRVAEVMGKDAALAICKEYGGEVLGIPRCHALRSEMRARAIRSAFDAGEDVNTLARRFDMTYRAIEQIINRAY
jgi:hypothetical protein